MPFSIGPIAVPRVAVLAPMAGITDHNFRLLCREHHCGMVYTELVNADCLLRGLRQSFRLVETQAGERPVGVQLYGWDPEPLAEAAAWVEANVACDLIDLNMGCPVPKVVSRGAGAALMREPKRVERLVRAVVDAVQLPVTAKTRSGWTEGEINALDVARAVQNGGGQCIAVHGRTRAQRHEGPVNWPLLAEIKNSVSIPVIGNGGIVDAESALAMREQTGVDAVMVGRGAIGNPWIFQQIDDAWHGREVVLPTVQQRLDMLERHLAAAVQTSFAWSRKARDHESAVGRAVSGLRGHLLRYVAGSPGEREFRYQLNDLHHPQTALDAARAAFGLPPTSPVDALKGDNTRAA